MSEIKLKPCPFCGNPELLLHQTEYEKTLWVIMCSGCHSKFTVERERQLFNGRTYTGRLLSNRDNLINTWNRRADNKLIRQSCKSCKHYAPDPNYRDGNMGNCRYLAKIWEKPFYVNEARTECDYFQAAERGNENG